VMKIGQRVVIVEHPSNRYYGRKQGLIGMTARVERNPDEKGNIAVLTIKPDNTFGRMYAIPPCMLKEG
jgi:hypothetical protein